MKWKKDPNVHFTDLCIYIDKNVPLIATSSDYPEVENNIYNYLWLLVKALAIKKRMFTKFEDYDGYAFYSANRLYFALKKNYLNQGKIIKGKEIKPIKSCLNYTKALLYPMKVEYQREAYNEVLSSEYISKKFDSFAYKEKLKRDAARQQPTSQWAETYLKESLKNLSNILDVVLSKSPFKPGSIDYKKLKISIMYNCLMCLKTKNWLSSEPTTVYTWKLPKSMTNYIKILLKEFYNALKVEIMDCYDSTKLDEQILETLITVKDSNYNDYED